MFPKVGISIGMNFVQAKINYFMKFLFRLLVLLFLLKLAYNYFLGDDQEKSSAQSVLDSAKEMSHSVGKMLSSEKESYEDGRYNQLLENLSNSLLKLKTSDAAMSKEVLEEIEREEEVLKQEYESLKMQDESSRMYQKKQINHRLMELLDKSLDHIKE